MQDNTQIIIGLAIMCLVALGVFVCTVYLCFCLQPQEDDGGGPPGVNHIRTIASAPEEEWLQFSPTNVGHESRHLFTNNNNNQASNRDVVFNIDDIYIPGLGLRNDHGSNDSDHNHRLLHHLNVDNGFNHPLARHHTLDLPSISSDHDFNQPSLKYQKPLHKIETPPPSYFEATKDLYNLNYSHRQNQRDTDRGLCFNGSVLVDTASNNNGSRSSDRHVIAGAGRRVGWDYEQSDTTDGNTMEHISGIAGNSRNITEGETRYRNDRDVGAGVGYSSGRSNVGNEARYSDSRDVSGSGTGYNNDNSAGQSGERRSNETESGNNGSRGVIGTGGKNVTPSDKCENGRCVSGINIRSEYNCGSTHHIEIQF